MAVAAGVVWPCKSSPFLGRFPSHSCRGAIYRGKRVENRARSGCVKALFWGPKKVEAAASTDFSLGEFNLTASLGTEEFLAGPKKVFVSVVSSILDIASRDWDACALDATGVESFNPFITHGFLSSLEESGSAVKETGWIPQHVIARDEAQNVLGVIPLYLKSHSYGEYVFDRSWADAYYSYGARYYPKLQCCVPFTPVTSPRILIRDSPYKDQIFDILATALKALTEKLQVSSLHITFPNESEWIRLKTKGFMQRVGMQYHWKNRDYKNFDDFLMDMKQTKRKNIRQERKKISQQNLTMKRLRGDEIKARHWDSFYKFYRNTTDNKWGNAYLRREFFHIMGSKMGDRVMLIVAEDGDELVAGALNLIGGNTIYGRLWGCAPQVYYPSLHFEACYYQAIEAAIELKLNTVEAGAQGEHKIQRGYLPVMTYSSHYLLDKEFGRVIENFLQRETTQLEYVMNLFHASGPFKEGIHEDLGFSTNQ